MNKSFEIAEQSQVPANHPAPQSKTPSNESQYDRERRQYADWRRAAAAVQKPLDKLPLPFAILAGEGIDLIAFCRRYWAPAYDETGRVTRPGLGSAAGSGTFREGIADELEQLVSAVQLAQTDYRMVTERAEAAPVARAEFVLSEIRATLGWLLYDQEHAEALARLEALDAAHGEPRAHDALAAALYDYAELARRLQVPLEGLGGFHAGFIDEARALGCRLRTQSAVAPEARGREREALDLRNRLATLLWGRMLQVRAAARFVFRAHPALVREAASAFLRRGRAARKKRAGEQGAGSPEADSPGSSSTLR